MTPRVLVATPVFGNPWTGSVSVGYLMSSYNVARMVGVKFTLHTALMNCDLVRARSRAVRTALDMCATHLLFWDADVSGLGSTALLGMLNEEVDVISCPYPRKNGETAPTHEGLHVPMGFTLISNACLEKMWDHYYDELHFDDIVDGKATRTVALFQLLMVKRDLPRPHRVLLGEDYSFCERWARIGGTVHLYKGPGSPMAHIGTHAFKFGEAAQ